MRAQKSPLRKILLIFFNCVGTGANALVIGVVLVVNYSAASSRCERFSSIQLQKSQNAQYFELCGKTAGYE